MHLIDEDCLYAHVWHESTPQPLIPNNLELFDERNLGTLMSAKMFNVVNPDKSRLPT